MSQKTIDYLFEDPPIPSQQYALVSIVGPHMPQKCDVWGLKIRGVAENLDKAKTLSQKILKIDKDYDIYTVEVGKFFPLVVDPLAINNVEYQNSELNTLIKSYLENRELANEHWHERKNEMIKEAIREGRDVDFANRPEHPVAVLLRQKNYEDSIKETNQRLEELQQQLQATQQKYQTYSVEERDEAERLYNQNNTNTATNSENVAGNSKDTTDTNVIEVEETTVKTTDEIESIVSRIQALETEISDLRGVQNTLLSSTNAYKRLDQSIADITTTINQLKTKLNDSGAVNSYINKNYPDSPYNL